MQIFSYIKLATFTLLIGAGLGLSTSYGQTLEAGTEEFSAGPIRAFVRDVQIRTQSKSIDLRKPFAVDYEFAVDANGTLDPGRFKVLKETGDAALIRTTTDGIEALGRSGYFSLLRSLSIDRGSIAVSQDGSTFSFVVKATAKSANHARTIRSGLGAYLAMAKVQVVSEVDKATLRSMTLDSNGPDIVISFVFPTDELEQLAAEKLN